MNPPAAVPPARRARLVVAPATEPEAAKIRELMAAWVGFERSAARLGKSRRWQAIIAHVNAAVASVVHGPLLECRRTWLDWQTLRLVRLCAEKFGSKLFPADAPLEGARSCAGMFIELNGSNEVRHERWRRALLSRPILGTDPETAMTEAAAEAVEYCRAELAARGGRRSPSVDHRAAAQLYILAYENLDAGHCAALVVGTESASLRSALFDPARAGELITPASVNAHHAEFLRAYGALVKPLGAFSAQIERRGARVAGLVPTVVRPEPAWSEARFFQWLLDESVAAACERMCRASREALNLQARFDVSALLAAPLCWRLWLEEQWETARLGAAAEEPQRTVLRQLVESPARFMRLPNPTPAVAAMRRVFRAVSDLLEGSPLAVERAELVATLRAGTIPSDEVLHLLAIYCARRWQAGMAPKIRARLVERFRVFLREEIVPQGPEILRQGAIEIGPALRTAFDADYEKLMADEEAAQEQFEVAMRHHAESWRAGVPVDGTGVGEPSRTSDVRGGIGAGQATEREAVVIRYVANLGEPRLRELRIATTWAALENELEAFCQREGIAVSIPFSSIAHALAHYVLHTPSDKKQVWPRRETYGPLELHKIKRGGMRLLVRESGEGVWLHLLQRKDWFLGER
jgi:hypothetical protein